MKQKLQEINPTKDIIEESKVVASIKKVELEYFLKDHSLLGEKELVAHKGMALYVSVQILNSERGQWKYIQGKELDDLIQSMNLDYGQDGISASEFNERLSGKIVVLNETYVNRKNKKGQFVHPDVFSIEGLYDARDSKNIKDIGGFQ